MRLRPRFVELPKPAARNFAFIGGSAGLDFQLEVAAKAELSGAWIESARNPRRKPMARSSPEACFRPFRYRFDPHA